MEPSLNGNKAGEESWPIRMEKEGVMCGRRKKTVVRSAMMYGSEEKHFREV